MKKLICLLVFCMMLCGCGNKESDPISNKPPIEVDEEKLESEGYKNLAEIAYGKVEDNGDKPNVNLVYLTQKPEEAIYLWTGIQRNLLGNNVESDTSFSWGDNKYVLDDESMDKMTAENAEDYVPKEWVGLLRKMESGYNINDGISKELGDSMDEAIDEFVDEYLEIRKNGNNEKEIEEEENVLAKKTYNIGEDYFSFSLSEKGGEQRFSLSCHIEDKFNALYTHVSLNSIINNSDENVKVVTEKFYFSYGIVIGDGTVLFRTPDVLSLIKDNEVIDVEEYFSTEWLASESGKESEYGTKVIEFMMDFIENN